jgi:hypothetical protein
MQSQGTHPPPLRIGRIPRAHAKTSGSCYRNLNVQRLRSVRRFSFLRLLDSSSSDLCSGWGVTAACANETRSAGGA